MTNVAVRIGDRVIREGDRPSQDEITLRLDRAIVGRFRAGQEPADSARRGAAQAH